MERVLAYALYAHSASSQSTPYCHPCPSMSSSVLNPCRYTVTPHPIDEDPLIRAEPVPAVHHPIAYYGRAERTLSRIHGGLLFRPPVGPWRNGRSLESTAGCFSALENVDDALSEMGGCPSASVHSSSLSRTTRRHPPRLSPVRWHDPSTSAGWERRLCSMTA